MRTLKDKKSQVWVETVVYTIIGLTLIAVILATAIPQIDKMKDRAVIDQTLTAMNTLDRKISEVEQTSGNVRGVEFKISKGKLEINGERDEIKYLMEDTGLRLSEEDSEIKQGNIVLKTEKIGSKYRISLIMKYDNLNLTYGDEEITKTINAGPAPYNIVIENKDLNLITQKIQIDFSIV